MSLHTIPHHSLMLFHVHYHQNHTIPSHVISTSATHTTKSALRPYACRDKVRNAIHKLSLPSLPSLPTSHCTSISSYYGFSAFFAHISTLIYSPVFTSNKNRIYLTINLYSKSLINNITVCPLIHDLFSLDKQQNKWKFFCCRIFCQNLSSFECQSICYGLLK